MSRHWRGCVLSVGDDAFVAKLTPLGRQGPVQEAEIRLDKVGDDRELVEPGAVFYWTVTEHESVIRFQRLPPWAEDEIKAAEVRARELLELLQEGIE
ncbi:MAG: hypothetical protein ACTSPX_03370 [Candidatus Thorarchaeota archaeon]